MHDIKSMRPCQLIRIFGLCFVSWFPATCFAQLTIGESVPRGAESAAVGFGSAKDAIGYGSETFQALGFCEVADVAFSAEFPESHYMLPELVDKIRVLSDAVKQAGESQLPPEKYQLKVMAAWKDATDSGKRWEYHSFPQPEAVPAGGGETMEQRQARELRNEQKRAQWEAGFWTHHEGRGVDLTILVGDQLQEDPTKLPLLGKLVADSKQFDWVHLAGEGTDTPSNPADDKALYVHASIARPSTPELSSRVVALQDKADLDGMALNHLNNLVDYTDAEALDSVIRRFPGTDAGLAAYSVRYQLLRAAASEFFNDAKTFLREEDLVNRAKQRTTSQSLINAYHQFLYEHPNRIGRHIALIDLLQLVRYLDDPLGYVDFIRRYPGTPEAQIAIACLHQVEFERRVHIVGGDPLPGEIILASMGTYADSMTEARRALITDGAELTTREVLASLDVFLQHNPTAAQWTTAATIARQFASEAELAVFDNATEVDRVSRARAILSHALADYRSLRALVNTDSSATLLTSKRRVIDAYQNPEDARFFLERIERWEQLLGEYYRSSDAFHDLFQIQLHIETNERLERISRQISDIQSQLRDNHARLIDTLQTEFRATRNILADGFDKLAEGLTIQLSALREQLSQNFDQLSNNLSVLHNDFVVVHEKLDKQVAAIADVKKSVEAVKGEIQTTNAALDEVMLKEVQLKQSIEELDKTVKQGFAEINPKLAAINVRLHKRPTATIAGIPISYSGHPSIYSVSRGASKVVFSSRHVGPLASSGKKIVKKWAKAKKAFRF